MADQEFSSPGDHMASMSSGSSFGSSSRVSFGPPVANLSNVIYAPRASSLARDTHVGNVPVVRRSRDRDDLSDYLSSYIKYNEGMYRSSQEWEKMMSDTAIRRQMQDLKAAGINPILAGRLGGATWHAVNAPYNSISPASAYSSMYAADKTSENTKIQVAAELERTNLTNDNMLQIARENNLNQKEISALLNSTNVVTQAMRDKVDTAGQDKSLVGSILHTGIGFLGSMAYIAARNKNKGNSGYDGPGSVYYSDYDLRQQLRNSHLSDYDVDRVLNGRFTTAQFGDAMSALGSAALLAFQSGVVPVF